MHLMLEKPQEFENIFTTSARKCLQSDVLKIIMGKYKTCENALFAACANNNIDKVKELLDQSNHTSINKKEINLKCLGLTALHVACIENDDTDIAEILIQNGANINATTDHGYTPLMYAIKYQKINFIEFLLQKNADLDAKS